MASNNRQEPWQAGADRKIWAIAGPAILANSSAPLVGLVDAWAVGHLPSNIHLAAIGLGATIFTYIFWTFGFLRMGTTGFVAQAFGRDDTAALVRLMLRVILTSLVIAVLILVLQAPLFHLATLAPDPPVEVRPELDRYLDIRIWSAPATLVFYGINGFLIGTAQARKAMWLHLLLNSTNGALNVLFVIGLGMGVSGVALGTVIAEWLTVLVGLVILVRYLGSRAIIEAIAEAATWRLQRFMDLFKVNSMLLLRTLLLITALALVMREASVLGSSAVAASHIANTFFMLVSLGLDGLAYSGEALAGAAWGRRNQPEFRYFVKRTSLWAAATSVAYALFFLVGYDWLVATLTDLPDVRRAASDIMPLLVMLPLVAFACFQFDGIYIGATAADLMLLTMVVATAAYVPLLMYLGGVWGLAGIWTAVIVFMAVRGLGQLLAFPMLERRLAE